ncbi:MAG: amidohydrolase [Ornithinimicrobium sp.]|uniref:amidohydrolase n=1 Tax=Ornithinimicrobium sp. TaxID=1977084 RepID=UPI003D9B94BD
MTAEPATALYSGDLTRRIVDAVEGLRPSLLHWRRELHAYPEVSWQEHRTTALIMDQLSETSLRLTPLAGSGVIADLGPPRPRRRIAIRADLDALPIEESTELDFASRNPGVAHACGHDVHTIGVLGAALALAEVTEQLDERGLGVRFLFQPAEESMPGGAHAMMQASALAGIDRLYAVHCDPSIDVGTVGLRVGPITAASDSVHVTLTGRGGHTSRPHLTQDLTYALGKVITDVPAVLSRRMDPRSGTALVWGAVRAGTVANVVPASGECVGTLRMLDAQTWDTTGPLIEEIVHAVVAPYGVHATVRHVKGVPPVDNDASCVAAFDAACRAVVGPQAVVPTQQSLGGEDLGWYLTQVPGAMARLGTRTPGGPTFELHQGDLVVDEEAVLHAAKILAAVVLH